MKTAIYIEDGVTQLVLTPETEHEKDIVKGFGAKLNEVKVFEGTFYDSRGGWIRQTAYRDRHYSGWNDGYGHDVSLILRVGAKASEVSDLER